MIVNINLYKESIEKVLKSNKISNLNNSSILITGANGMIASAIIDVLNYLNENNNTNIKIIGSVRNKQIVLDRFNEYKNLEIIEYDVNNELLYDGKVDYIINAASNADPKKFSTEPVETITSNIIGTKNLLDYSVKNNVKKFLEISSGEVYGQGSEDIKWFNEDYSGYIDSTNPRACYPLGKLASENLCVAYSKQYNLYTIIARLCHIYGPTQKETDSRVSAQFIRNVLNDEDIVMKSTGSQIRSYCYILDAITGILKLLESGENAKAYNVANNNSILSIKEMSEEIAKTNNKKVIFELPDDIEKNGYNPVTRSILNGEKLEELGWVPCYNFNEGITETIKIMKK